MGVSSTRVGDHRGSARTVQYLSKNHMMVSGLRSARSGALPHLAVFAAESPVLCLPSLSSLLSLPSLSFLLSPVSRSFLSLSISSRLVILGWQWSASPGVVRFHPGLSPLLIVSLPPPTRVGTCLLFQVSSFKLLGLEYPPSPPLPPRAALSRILGASLLGHSPHRISPPSLPLLCGVNGERDSTDSPHSLLFPPRRLALEPHGSPPSLSLRTLVCLIASSPPSISLRVCVCKRRELDLTLPLPSLFPRAGEAHVLYSTSL